MSYFSRFSGVVSFTVRILTYKRGLRYVKEVYDRTLHHLRLWSDGPNLKTEIVNDDTLLPVQSMCETWNQKRLYFTSTDVVD